MLTILLLHGFWGDFLTSLEDRDEGRCFFASVEDRGPGGVGGADRETDKQADRQTDRQNFFPKTIFGSSHRGGTALYRLTGTDRQKDRQTDRADQTGLWCWLRLLAELAHLVR